MGINILLSSPGPFEVFLAIIAIIASILSIVLFFKLWKMTNNVQEILDLLKFRIAPDVSTQTSVSTKEAESNKDDDLIGRFYPGTLTSSSYDSNKDDDLIGRFYQEARQLQLSLLSESPNTAEEDFNLSIGTLVTMFANANGEIRLLRYGSRGLRAPCRKAPPRCFS